MADKPNLDIKKVIDQGAQHATLNDLKNRGVTNVKVLDENAIQQMIAEAVDQVVSMANKEERAKLVAESRNYLNRLVKERNESMSEKELLEANKNELMQQVERLQEELKARRQADEREEAMRSDLEELEKLRGENEYLRDEHNTMIEKLDALMTENKELKEEIARLRALLEGAQAEKAEAEARLAETIEGAKEARAGIKEERDEALRELEETRAQLVAQEEADQQAKQEAEELERREAEEKARQEEEERARQEAEEKAHQEEEERARQEAEEKARQEEEERARLEAEAEAAKKPMGVPLVIVEGYHKGRSSPTPLDPSRIVKGKGLDIGTVNLVAAEQDEEGNVLIRQKRNAFIDIEITAYTKSMLTRLNVPYVVQGNKMYVLGEDAFELANVLNKNTRRPMKDGLISPQEQDALPVMKLLISAILGEPRVDGEVCFYSVPGDPVDSELSVAYHRDLFDAVLQSLGYAPKHIIEGHAVTFSELVEDDFTGIGVSCGGGMFNICVAYKSMPALSFSTSRSGDWIDQNVATAMGIRPAKAAMLKEAGLDLMNPKNREEDAIAIYYQNLINYNIVNIKERFENAENMPSFPDPVPMVFSGGTSLAHGFIDLARSVFSDLEFPIPISELRMAKDPLNATAKGCLTAAMLEMAHQGDS